MHDKVTVGASQCDCVTRAVNEGAVRVKPCFAQDHVVWLQGEHANEGGGFTEAVVLGAYGERGVGES